LQYLSCLNFSCQSLIDEFLEVFTKHQISIVAPNQENGKSKKKSQEALELQVKFVSQKLSSVWKVCFRITGEEIKGGGQPVRELGCETQMLIGMIE
jgi:hypothetical protein